MADREQSALGACKLTAHSRLQYVHIFVFKEKNDGLEKSADFSTI